MPCRAPRNLISKENKLFSCCILCPEAHYGGPSIRKYSNEKYKSPSSHRTHTAGRCFRPARSRRNSPGCGGKTLFWRILFENSLPSGRGGYGWRDRLRGADRRSVESAARDEFEPLGATGHNRIGRRTRTARSHWGDRPTRAGRRHGPGRTDRPDRTDRRHGTGGFDRRNRTGRFDRRSRTCRPDRTDRLHGAGGTGGHSRTCRTDRPDRLHGAGGTDGSHGVNGQWPIGR